MNLQTVLMFIAVLIFFALAVKALRVLAPKIMNNPTIQSSRFMNAREYLPDEELSTMRQVFFLIMIILFVFIILYYISDWSNGIHMLAFIDIVVSIYLAYGIDTDTFKDYFMRFSLLPFNPCILFSAHFIDISLDSNIFITIIFIVSLLHVMVYAYFIRVYYKKFLEYTETNSLGITIMLLFLIIFISFFVTIFVEHVSPLDSMVMVSNAFTSNGYAILGNSSVGKVNSLLLVWSGFVLSGVGTATLAVAIVMKHVNEKFDKLEELAKKNKKN